MELSELLGELAETIGLFITLDSERRIIPTAEYFDKMLDRAAGDLYSEPIEARWSGGPLIVEKRADGHEVFIRVGFYK